MTDNDIRSLQDIHSWLGAKVAQSLAKPYPVGTISANQCINEKIELLRTVQAMLLPFVDAEYEALSKDEEL